MCSLLPSREDENSFLVTSEHGFGPGDIDVTTKVKEVVVSVQFCSHQARLSCMLCPWLPVLMSMCRELFSLG